jgi:predicted nucleic acid-binding protein
VKFGYFDSSAILVFLLQQPGADQALEFWYQTESKTSSILLEAECLITLRRSALKVQGADSEKWLSARIALLNQCIQEITLKELDASILEIIQRETALAECRTLDAIHLATALFFRERGDEDYVLVSYDERMRKTAAKLQLRILPETLLSQ